MAINQLSTSNTFQQWLTATQQLITVANTITDGYTLNTASILNLTGAGQTLNVLGTASITNVRSNSINANTIIISGISGVDISLNVANSIWVGGNVTITNNLTVGNVTITGTQILACTEFGTAVIGTVSQPLGGRLTQSDGSSIIFRLAGNVQQLIANTNFFAGEIISTNSRNSLVATGNVVVTKNLSAGNINTSGNLVVAGNTFLGNGVHVVNYSNFDALRITNRGSGYSLLIIDEATDPSPLSINDDGVFVKGDLSPFVTRVGGTTITPEIQQVGSVNANSSFASFSYSADPTISPHYLMARSRGTKTSPTLVSEGDILGRISSAGWDGAKFVESSRIEFKIDPIAGAGGVPALNDMPGAISFLITNDGDSSPTERLKVNTTHLWANTQNFEMKSLDGFFTLGSFENLNTVLQTKRSTNGINSRFKIKGETLTDSTMSIFTFATNVLAYPGYHLARARGTELAPLSVIDGSGLGYISAAGFHEDVTNYSPLNKFTEGARIQFTVEGTPYANSIPTKISLMTAAPTSAAQAAPTAVLERMSISSNGNVSIGSSLLDYSKLTVYDDSDNTAVYIQNAGSGDSLRVLATGTGNAISVYDIASDTTPFRIDSIGDTYTGRDLTVGNDFFPSRYVSIGGSNATTSLNVKVGTVTYTSLFKIASDTTNGSLQSLFNFTASGWPGLTFARARGTQDAPTSVTDGSLLGLISASGYTSETAGYLNKYTEGARIQFVVDGTPGANSVPTSMEFLTSPGGSGSSIPIVQSRMKIDPSGNVGIGTTSPTAKLEVVQSGSGAAFKAVTDAPFTINSQGHTYIEANLTIGSTSTNTNVSTTKVGVNVLSPAFRLTGAGIPTSHAFISNYSLSGYPSILFGRGTGSEAAAANVADGSVLGIISAAGWHANSNFGGSKFTEGTRIQFAVDGTPSGNSVPGEIVFFTASGANALTDAVTLVTERMRIRAGGNVGISQPNPTAKLHINGNDTFPTLRVVQAGTGNAFEVYDGLSDATPFRIDSIGNVYAGANVTLTAFNAGLTGNTPLNVFRFADSDGTVVANQPLGKIEFYTSDANNPSVASYILASAVGTSGGANLRFAASSDAANAVEVLRMSNTAITSFRNFLISADNSDITTGSPSNALRFVDTDTTVVANQLLGEIEFFTSDANNPGVASYISASAVGASGGSNLTFGASSGAGTTRDVLQISNTGVLVTTSNVGIGYGPGTGASVTQSDIPVGGSSARQNPVTINAMSGRIVCANVTSTIGGYFHFNVWNSCVSTGDVILACQSDWSDDFSTRHRYSFYAVAVHNGRFVLSGERSFSVNNSIPYDTVTANFVVIKGSSS